MIRVATWNIGTLIGKSIELVYAMKRRVNVIFLQETKWKENKAKELIDGYKLFCIGKDNTRNGVGRAIELVLEEDVTYY